MGDEIQLQRAIYASLQRAPAPRSSSSFARSSAGPTITRGASRTPGAHQRAGAGQARRTAGLTSRESSTAGRVNALQRSGIAPAVRGGSARRLGPAPAKKRVPCPASPGPGSAPKAGGEYRPPAELGESTAAKAIKDRAASLAPAGPAVRRAGPAAGPAAVTGQDGWVRRTGTGTFVSFVRDGALEGSVENSNVLPTLLVYAPADGSAECVRAGNYRITLTFKCAHAAPASGHLPAFSLALRARVAKGHLEMLCVHVDCFQRTWTVERHERDAIVELHKCQDRELRPGAVHAVRLEVRDGARLSLFCDRRTIFEEAALGETVERGAVGFALAKSKLNWYDMRLEAAEGSVAGATFTERYVGDDPRLVETIERDIIQNDLGVSFDDIASLGEAKRLLNEAVTLPLIIPEFFTGIQEPWKGVLLFGPPGTGKTLLAKAVATMNRISFFNCSSSSLMSKWRGESEKLVRVLFNMAHHYAPSIVFFDEVDALISRRGADSEHEASRRFKSELLSQMDGLTSGSGGEGKNVLVLATSNCPWDVDEAMRRRLEKRIYIPLPDFEARKRMFEIYLSGAVRTDADINLADLATDTAGFSGADVKLLCRDASMQPVRRLVADKTPDEIRALKDAGKLDEVLVSREDFAESLSRTSPSVCDVERYEQWRDAFAST